MKEFWEHLGALPAEVPVVLVEGFLLFHDPPQFDRIDVMMFVDTDETVARERRKARSRTRWSDSYWDDTIWPNYLLYNEDILAGKFPFIHRVDGNREKQQVLDYTKKLLFHEGLWEGEKDQMTGTWESDTKGIYYIRQIQEKIVWVGISRDFGSTWCRVASGSIVEDTVILEWTDMPKGSKRLHLTGKLELKWHKSESLLTRVDSSQYPAKQWKRL